MRSVSETVFSSRCEALQSSVNRTAKRIAPSVVLSPDVWNEIVEHCDTLTRDELEAESDALRLAVRESMVYAA